ncbi:MAG: glycosyltransferase family 39 protein, partial [Saprospiraceae bacterium]|nr:glycosyltransferase family 39 protein [Saprospiraceae bacterium]
MAKKKKPDPVRTTEPRLAEKSPTSAPGWLERNWIPELILVAAAILVYMSSLDNGFVFFDDDKAILYNKTLQNPSLSGFFSGQNLGMYAPLSWIAYWLGQNISGQEAWGYHALGLVLHALNAVLAFIFLFRLTGLRKAAFFAALLFAVHPVQVEAVSWAAALSTVLFSTFYLSALLAYLKWRRSPTPLWLAASLLFFAAACLSKSAAVTLPLVLFAVDFYLDKKLLRKFWLSKIPFFLLSFVFGLYTFSTRAQEG